MNMPEIDNIDELLKEYTQRKKEYDEPSTIDLVQIPLPPLRQLAGIPLALLPIQGIAPHVHPTPNPIGKPASAPPTPASASFH